MKIKYVNFILVILFLGCDEKKEISSTNHKHWEERKVNLYPKDSLEYGKTYLSIYSEIYSISQERTQKLTGMASIRNTSELDTIYILRAEYFDSHGKSVRKYFDSPIYLAPMESTEIIIDLIDVTGGTGSNFIFEWKTPKDCPEPLFEGIMSSTLGQQGLSFISQGKRVL